MAVARNDLGRAARKRGIEGRRQNLSVFTYGNRVRSCLKIALFHTVLRKCVMDRTYGNRVRSCLKIALFHTVLRKCVMDRTRRTP